MRLAYQLCKVEKWIDKERVRAIVKIDRVLVYSWEGNLVAAQVHL